jgi:hypothetical protein
MASKFPRLTVQFVDPDGTVTTGLSFVPQAEKEPDRFADNDQWNEDRCLREFVTAVRAGDSHGAEACLDALDRLRLWHEGFERLGSDAEAVPGESILWLWTSYGFHVSDSLNGDPVLARVLKGRLPPYEGPGRILYRGEALDRYRRGVYGMSWTPETEVARTFAVRRKEGGAMLKLDASAAMIFSGPSKHSIRLAEYEYLVDPTLIANVVAIDI